MSVPPTKARAISRRTLVRGGFLREFVSAMAAPPVPPAPHGTEERVARVLPSACIAFRGVPCFTCAERCPVPGALTLERGRPVVDRDLCDGCGNCVPVCPAPLPALTLAVP